ncbi:MAG: NADH-quinone oxidoreductase subunit NuoE [Alphaproteobacteria bacterium]
MSGPGVHLVSNGAFAFDDERQAEAQRILARYPAERRQSAVIPLLDLAQRQNGGWLSREAVEHVAVRLDMPAMRVTEVASFYYMLNLAPVGRTLVQVCRTTPCWLRGSEALSETCRRTLGIDPGGTSDDGCFTLIEVECLGACVNAPMVQINDDYYEDLTPDSLARILEALKRGETPPSGSQSARQGSAPAGGPTVLAGDPVAAAGARAQARRKKGQEGDQ